MRRRFKTKRKKYHNIFLFTFIIVLIYISFSFIYRILYKNYLSKIESKNIIEDIINNSKNNYIEKDFFSKYKDPKYILKYTLNTDLDTTIKIDNIVDKNEQPSTPTINDNIPLVYIYSTHETEKYSGAELKNYNLVPDVKIASYILENYLEDLGISTIVEKESVTEILRKNNWAYKRSYEASKELASKKIYNYSSLKLIIDLHRDSSKLEKTLLEYKNNKYARVLFVIGAEYDNYENNYSLANKINTYLEELIPGISRGIIKKSGLGVDGVYNQDLSQFSILIEIGGQYNKIDEVNNTLSILAKAILKYLEGEIWKIAIKPG